MFEDSLILQSGTGYIEMVYFPLQINSLIAVLISAIATIIILTLSLIFKLYKRPTALMVLTMNIAHFSFYYSKLSVLVYQPESDFHCRILTIMHIYGLQSAVIWGALFAHAFYIVVKYHETCDVELPRMVKYYMLIAVALPLFNGILAAICGQLEYSDVEKTCVHRVYRDRFDVNGNIWVRIPVAFACIASLFWYKRAINTLSALQGKKKKSAELYILMIYPSILLFCWGPHGVLQVLIQLGLHSPTVSALSDIFVFLTNLQGTFDAIVYGRSIGIVVIEAINTCLGKNPSKEKEKVVETQVLESSYERDMRAPTDCTIVRTLSEV